MDRSRISGRGRDSQLTLPCSTNTDRVGKPRGFTLVELLVVIGIISVLIGILLPSLSAARQAAQATQCLSNIRQLLLACTMYGNENNGYWPPAEADGYWTGANLCRWHGSRADANSAFDIQRDPSPLKVYLRTNAIKACPAVPSEMTRGFESGAGGYGYNENYIGGSMGQYFGNWNVPNDAYWTPAKMVQIRNTTQKIAFADTAFGYDWTLGVGLFEYSFAEAPLLGPDAMSWPSIHFRHGQDKACIGWADGHATVEHMEWTMAKDDPSNWYAIDFQTARLGWFGPHDNTLFQRN